MEEQTRRDIIAIALNNLIEGITISLEDDETCPKSEDDREYLEFLLAGAASILKEMADSDSEIPISKPRWDEL
ncbi:MAG: hypothetical protein NC131_06055 [Roseburia sp.]|nr:hypothetical protein [Roseburia sp.]